MTSVTITLYYRRKPCTCI